MALALPLTVSAAFGAELKFGRDELHARWKARIEKQLAAGKLPKIDMETSLREEQVREYFPDILGTMDELGIALSAFDGYQRPADGSSGYRWSDYILDLVNAHPDRVVPTANGGTNPNWLKEKGGNPNDFIDQMEANIRSGVYAHMGEFDFRHYMSSGQCQKGRSHRDVAIPLNGENGHRVFKLASEAGVSFSIHLEPEDAPLAQLEEMLAAYPKAKVVVAHFGQKRHPEAQGKFTPENMRRLFTTYPNLHYDLSSGGPNRKYRCSGPNNDEMLVGDNAIWDGPPGNQRDSVDPAWLAILRDFSDRFVFATDFGGDRPPLPRYLADKVSNFDAIVRELPEDAKHRIAYRNAWRLLTGKNWE